MKTWLLKIKLMAKQRRYRKLGLIAAQADEEQLQLIMECEEIAGEIARRLMNEGYGTKKKVPM